MNEIPPNSDPRLEAYRYINSEFLERLKSLDLSSCSSEHFDQNSCQKAHNYLTYGLGVIAHRLEQGDDPKIVAIEALQLRDTAEEIRNNKN